MLWVAIKLFMGSAVKRCGALVASLFDWSKRNPAWALLLIVSLVGGFYAWRLSNKLEHTKERLAATEKAFTATIVNYRLAQQEFEKKQIKNLKRVSAKQEELASAQIDEARVIAGDWRARFERLRAARNQSSPGKAGMPAISEVAGTNAPTDPNPGETANPEMIAIRIDDLEALVLNSVQGESIRKLWVANEAVDMSGE